MQKTFKRFAVVLLAMLATVCVALFAACDDETEYATDTFTVTVLDENGKAINGVTFGEDEYDPDNTQVKIQFCAIKADGSEGGCTTKNPEVGTDGKATVELDNVKGCANSNNTTRVELHILNIEAKGYKKAYGQYEVDEIPTKITVTLVKA